MDVKEVNSGLLNFLMANKNAQVSQAADNGFGSLLAGLDFQAPDAEVELKPAADKKTDKVVPFRKQASERPVLDSRPEVKTDKPAAKDDKKVSLDKNAAKADKPVADDKRPAENKTSGRKEPQVAEKDKVSVEAKDSANETVSVVEAVKENAPASEDVSVVSVDALALMGAVSVINPQTGELMMVNGAELAQQLESAGVEEVALLPMDGEKAALVAPLPSDSDVFAGILAEMEPVEGAEVKLAANMEVQPEQTAKAVEGEPEVENHADRVASQQASELSEVIGKDRKAKIEVTVKEEKIAAPAESSLLKDVKAVDSVVAAVMDTDGNPLLTEADNAGGVNMMVQDGGKNPAQAPVVAPVSAAVIENAKNAASDEALPSMAANTSSAAGSELVSSVRAQAAQNNEAPAFKDVYKGLGREVVDQIKVNITKSAVRGVDKIEIQLKPEDLGHIEVKMQIGKGGKLQAHIISSRPETAEILQKEMGNLQKAFSDAGFQTDEGSLSFSFREDGQAGRDQDKNNLRNFMGDIMEQETALDAVSGDLFAAASWDGKSALNIRV